MLKKVIREGVLETNSSSSHAVTLSQSSVSEYLLDTILPDRDGIIVLRGGEFGWDFEKYTDARTKANYLVLTIGYMLTDRIAKIASVLEENSLYDDLREVIMEQTGATDVVFDAEDGYIDHESTNVAKDALVSKEAMYNFIFNKHSILYTGNDNDSRDWDHQTGELVEYE